jgi:nucleoside-diphosphate-sugar epimerase
MVIGGSGYLGQRVIQSLLAMNYIIYALQHKTDVLQHENIKILNGGLEIVSSKLLSQIKPSYIFHCGRPTFSRFRFFGRKLAAQKALRLNKKLIKEIKKSEIETKLIFASGSLAYGNSRLPHSESSALNPISYSRQYIKGELPMVNEKGTEKFKVLTLRFPWLLGNASWFKWFYLQNIQQTNKIPLFGEGNNFMSLIDVNDAAILMVKYAEEVHHSGVFNIFSPSQITQNEFVEIVSQVFKVEIVPHSLIYPKLEAAAFEAFKSNILLNSQNTTILSRYEFKGTEETLRSIFLKLKS